MTYVEREAHPPAPGSQAADPSECVGSQRTRARSGGYRLGWRLAGAGVFAVSFAIAPGVEGALGGALGLLMLGVAWADARRFVVPNALSAGAFALGMIHAIVQSPDSGVRRRADGAFTRGFRRRIVFPRAHRLSALSRARGPWSWRCEIGRGGGRVVELAHAARGDRNRRDHRARGLRPSSKGPQACPARCWPRSLRSVSRAGDMVRLGAGHHAPYPK